jgi:hypothetical protein
VTRLRRQLQTSSVAYAFATALLGCSSSTPPAAPATSLSAPSVLPATPPLASSVAPAAGDHEPLPERASAMVDQLRPTEVRSVRSIAGACDDGSTLELKSTGAFDRRSARWVVVDVEHDLGEPPRIKWAGFVPVSGEEEEVRASRAEPPTSICSALTRDADLVDTPDLVDANAFEHYATGAASSLVRFDSWLLYLGESEHGDDALHLFRPGGDDHTVIMRRPARIGAFQVTACRRGDAPDTSCSPFRAYLGITAVRRAPDRRSLLVQGHAGPPGHAYAGPFHWVVPLNARVGGGP